MSNTSIPTEPITAEPVIINPTESESIETRLSKLEEALAAQKISPERSSSRQRQPRERERSRSPIFLRERSPQRRVEDMLILTNTTGLLAAIAKDPEQPDMLVEVQSGPGRCNSHMTYLTTIPSHQADLDKISWLFKLGVEDLWSQKQQDSYRIEMPGGTRVGRGRVEYYDERYEVDRYDRGGAPYSTILKLGTLFSVIFPSSGTADWNVDEEKVKFVTVIQGKGVYAPLRMIVSYSRRGALVDLFHELVNGYSVIFVGAVLKDVDFSASFKRGTADLDFKKVGSVEEAEKVDEGVVGIIC